MRDEDELAALRPRNLPHDLQSWNLEDLAEYCERLRAEIARVEAKIDAKKAVGTEAAALFKS